MLKAYRSLILMYIDVYLSKVFTTLKEAFGTSLDIIKSLSRDVAILRPSSVFSSIAKAHIFLSKSLSKYLICRWRPIVFGFLLARLLVYVYRKVAESTCFGKCKRNLIIHKTPSTSYFSVFQEFILSACFNSFFRRAKSFFFLPSHSGYDKGYEHTERQETHTILNF